MVIGGHVVRMTEDASTKQVLKYDNGEGRKTRRPRLHWKVQVHEQLSESTS